MLPNGSRGSGVLTLKKTQSPGNMDANSPPLNARKGARYRPASPPLNSRCLAAATTERNQKMQRSSKAGQQHIDHATRCSTSMIFAKYSDLHRLRTAWLSSPQKTENPPTRCWPGSRRLHTLCAALLFGQPPTRTAVSSILCLISGV